MTGICGNCEKKIKSDFCSVACRTKAPREVRDFLWFLWEVNRFSILYVAWLIQTWYMMGVIFR